MQRHCHHLLDGKRTGALLELEQDEMRGVGYNGCMGPKERLCQRVSHGAREQQETSAEQQQQDEANCLVCYQHGRWAVGAQSEGGEDMQTSKCRMDGTKQGTRVANDVDWRGIPLCCGQMPPKARWMFGTRGRGGEASAMPVPRHAAAMCLGVEAQAGSGQKREKTGYVWARARLFVLPACCCRPVPRLSSGDVHST